MKLSRLALPAFDLCLLIVFMAPPVAATSDPTPSPSGALARERRILAQTALERVYYSHRLWPKENPGPKPAFEKLVPAALIERKADAPLQLSAALQQFWSIEITPAMLQAELDRMERDSHDRGVLHELFAALGNDPDLIAETLARGNVAERMLRHQYAFDLALHADARRRAEAVAAQVKKGAAWRSTDATYSRRRFRLEDDSRGDADHAAELSATDLSDLRTRLAGRKPGALEENEDGWLLERGIDGEDGVLEVESLFLPKRSFDGWWPEARRQVAVNTVRAVSREDALRLPAPSFAPTVGCDSWDVNYMKPSPTERIAPSTIWTGSEMIVWGGSSANDALNSGSRYDPATDSWRTTAYGGNVPGKRGEHTAIWTGTEMVVWGGGSGTYLNTGGRYDPVTDTWVATSSTGNVPVARSHHTAVWTGTSMIIWGGNNGSDLNSGGRYNPATNGWLPTSLGANVPEQRAHHTAVWTGGVMIVWGGDRNGVSALNTGGRYDPATNTWLATSVGANVPVARRYHTAVWTGTQMIVWGGNSGPLVNSGGRYDPAADTWLPTSLASVPAPRQIHSAVWTGSEMIVWGGDGATVLNTGGRYNPTGDTWTPTSLGANVPTPRYYHAAVWTGTEMIIWGGGNYPSLPTTGGRYNPATDTWTPTFSGVGVPIARADHTAIWTGNEMIVWGGGHGYVENSGSRYNPATDVWTPTSVGGEVPSPREYHSAVWTGTEMIVWGGFDGSARINSGGRYDPAEDAWSVMSDVNVPPPRGDHTAVWTGSEMIVWGGNTEITYVATGGRYYPADDRWFATASDSGTPSARSFHTTVWTGGEMIVWGGFNGSQSLNSGGRYNPLTDSWTATSLGTNVPSLRNSHTAIWTGREMIIWGGSGGVNTGGMYKPGTDTWTPTSVGTDAPTARLWHTAVWTGKEMIVWGGTDGGFNYFRTGGRYDPATDTWITTSTTNVPDARRLHTAVWTGHSMIVWGGNPSNANTYLNTGGIYTFAAAAPGPVGDSLRLGKSATLDLSWTPAAGATSYFVRRCAACSPTAIVASPATNSYSEAIDAASYFFTVEAVNACGTAP